MSCLRLQMNLIVLMPCLDDARTAAELAVEIHRHAATHGHRASFLLVDDGSHHPLPLSIRELMSHPPFEITVLRLKKNVGHQRAIACGLCHIADLDVPADAIIVMDSDGEDLPDDVPALLHPLEESLESATVVFAERKRRSERLAFRVGYQFYLALHRIMVGQAPRVGNFTAITAPVVRSLVSDPNLWSHYAAAIWNSRYRRKLVPVHRGVRRRGNPKLGYASLVLHGLAAISCYRETLAVRMLAGSGIVFFLSLILLMAAIPTTWLASPSWSGAVLLGSGLLVCMALQLCIHALWQCLNTLQKRHQASFIPIRDYRWFVESATTLGNPSGAPIHPGSPSVSVLASTDLPK